MSILTPEQINQIYAQRKTKGQYESCLTEFLESGVNGVNVKSQWALQFPAEKKVATIKQGFENVKGSKTAPEGSENVDVIVDGDNVYLINRATLSGATVAGAAADSGTNGSPEE